MSPLRWVSAPRACVSTGRLLRHVVVGFVVAIIVYCCGIPIPYICVGLIAQVLKGYLLSSVRSMDVVFEFQE